MKKQEKLRPYQREAAGYAVAAIQAGKSPLICLPTGAGKTMTAAGVVKEMAKLGLKNSASLCHTTVLREQIGNRIEGIRSYTIQEFLSNNTLSAIRRADTHKVELLFIDEAHHIPSPEYKAVLKLFPNAHIFGMSATPARADGTGLGDVFDCLYGSGDETYFHPGTPYSKLIRKGHLVDCELELPDDMDRQKHKTMRIVADGVKIYLRKCKRAKGKGWRPGILFAKDISICNAAAQELRESGVRAESIDCNTEEAHTKKLILDYTLGRLDVLCSPIKLAEGFDAPRAEVCILERSADYITTFLQCVGRVLRPYGEEEIERLITQYGSEVEKEAKIPKEVGLLIDCTYAHQPHGLPTADRKWYLEGLERKPGQYTDASTWKPDFKPIRPYSIVDLDSTRVEATIQARCSLFRDRLMSQGMTKEKAEKESLRHVAEISGARLFPEAWKNEICNHCGKRIPVGSPYFYEAPDQPGQKSSDFHKDCWIRAKSKSFRKTG